jgi:gamma-glutamyltranspeptidase/glutathione hydrolase
LAHSLRLLQATASTLPPWGSTQHLALLTALMQELDRQRAAGALVYDVPGQPSIRESVQRVRAASTGTTHVSVCDAAGNLASLTTSNGAGSGCIVPGTGILLNNMMGEDDLHPGGYHASPPGQRVASMMSPSLLLGPEGALVLGSGGSKRIRTAMLQVISNVLDHGMPLAEAVGAPRTHWDGEHLQVEPGYDQSQLGALERRVSTNRWTRTSVYFGGVHAVASPGEAAGDPRRGGAGWVQP